MNQNLDQEPYVPKNFLWRIKNRYFSRQGAVRSYGRKLKEEVIGIILLWVVALVANFILYYGFNMLWVLYQETPVGRSWARRYHDVHRLIENLLSEGSPAFILEVTLTAFAVCMIVAAAAQFLHIARMLFHSRGIIGKLVLWVAPLILASAWRLNQSTGWDDMTLASAACALPVLILFNGCFNFTYELVPELGQALKTIGMAKDEVTGSYWQGFKNQMQKIADWINEG